MRWPPSAPAKEHVNDSVYAPPKSDLSQPAEAGSDGDNAFYVVSMLKFTLLFIFTLGMYRLYWFYKNWSSYKDRSRYAGSTDGNIWPIPRTIFSIFFIHSLFYKVDEYATEKQRPLNWKVDTSATILVLLVIVSNICGRLWDKDIGLPLTGYIWIASIPAMYFSCRNAQQFINISCGDPEGTSNSQLTGANWAWMVVGSIFWLLTVAGLLMPELAA
jgi:hypothetical protein